MDGVVTAKRIEEGEVAVIGVQNQPGTVLLTISDMSVVEAEMEIDETSIPSVALGQAARVHVDAYPNKTFDGVVTEVGNSPINATVEFRTKRSSSRSRCS
jgi:HlyD family secretion protein